ncbi:hypothetical protein C483_16001 [Natrialba hulunbeirensis JCM 10989]|uniref:Uncharacterized protein n=1 Tax=Natrialba hulunbeirensis JCM 10989 TaxID=1227493 RepID=L9ZQ70_9EURY|nr:DUF6517 family protein [Natrialba hulunbeirensis]ELY88231.1 hypothetical protein C483_16001 [Natrialba hulunbeirensis JCM 10989]
MDLNRRTMLGGIGTASLAGLAGCLTLVGLATHEASPAGVDESVRAETGYEQTRIDDLVVREEVGASIATEEVVVTNYMTEHEKAVDMGPLGRQRGAVFIVLSTPQVSVLGQQVNPVSDMSTGDLVELVVSNYDDLSNVELEEESAATVADQSTTQSRFSANASFDGTDVDVALHITEAVEAGEDLLVTIGVYPRDLDWQEEENIFSLMDGVVPAIDEEAGEGDGGNGDEGDEATDDGDDDSDGDGDADDGDSQDDTAGDSDDETGDDEDDSGDDEDDDDDDDDGILSTIS